MFGLCFLHVCWSQHVMMSHRFRWSSPVHEQLSTVQRGVNRYDVDVCLSWRMLAQQLLRADGWLCRWLLWIQ